MLSRRMGVAEVVGKYQPVSPFLIVGLLFKRKSGWPEDPIDYHKVRELPCGAHGRDTVGELSLSLLSRDKLGQVKT